MAPDRTPAADLERRVAELEEERDRLRDRLASVEALVALHDLRPVPPVELRVRVGGWDDPDHFLGVGRKAYHRSDYIAAHWQRGLPRGINNHQDAYVLVRDGS